MANKYYPNIFTPLKVGPIELKNRMHFAPMVAALVDAETGRVTPEMVEFIGAQAKSGAGLITIGSSPVEFSRGRDYMGCLSVTSDYDIPGLMMLAEEAHRYGAKLSVEFQFAGRIADPLFLGGVKAIVPSVTEDMDPNVFSEITKEEIDEVIDLFVKAAIRVKKAGFDMIMLHGGHGNLTSAFFSPLTNKRTDEYGGSLEKRMTFGLKMAKALREAVGDSMAIEFRISQHEFLPGSPSWDDIIAYVNAMAEYIDIVNISNGLIWHPYYVRYMMPSYLEPRCLNVDAAAYIKPRVKIPLAVAGNIPDVDTAEKILADGKADLITSARTFLPDFDVLKKAKKGQPEKIRPCLHCLECVLFPNVGHSVRCAVNMTLGRETRYGRIFPSEAPGKVMIVGGGTAGMTAAQTAIKRGHEVVLYEAADKLGGRLYEASAMYAKDYHRRYLKWMVDTTNECGAKIVLNTKVTPEIVETEAPDILIIAIGAEHIIPDIKGVENTDIITVSDVDLKEKEVGHKVVFCGAGLSAAECAFDLTKNGHECVLIDMKPREVLYNKLMESLDYTIQTTIDEMGIELIDKAAIKEINDKYVVIEKDGAEIKIEADSVVFSFGLKKNKEEIEALMDIAPDTYVVGDANIVGNIRTSNMDAFDVMVEL